MKLIIISATGLIVAVVVVVVTSNICMAAESISGSSNFIEEEGRSKEGAVLPTTTAGSIIPTKTNLQQLGAVAVTRTTGAMKAETEDNSSFTVGSSNHMEEDQDLKEKEEELFVAQDELHRILLRKKKTTKRGGGNNKGSSPLVQCKNGCPRKGKKKAKCIQGCVKKNKSCTRLCSK